jgi:hypothetical protein
MLNSSDSTHKYSENEILKFLNVLIFLYNSQGYELCSFVADMFDGVFFLGGWLVCSFVCFFFKDYSYEAVFFKSFYMRGKKSPCCGLQYIDDVLSYVDLIYSSELGIQDTTKFHICFTFRYMLTAK